MWRDECAYPIEVDLLLHAYDGPGWAVAPFRHRAGWLLVAEARRMTPFGMRSATLIAAVSDQGEVLPPALAARILDIPTSLPRDAECDAPSELDDAFDDAHLAFCERLDADLLGELEDAQAKVDARIRSFWAECAAFERKLSGAIRELRRKRLRDDPTAEELAAIETRLARLAEMSDELGLGMRRRTAEIRAETDELEAAVFEALEDHGEVEPLHVLRWRARRGGRACGDWRLSDRRETGLTLHLWSNPASGRTLDDIAAMRIFRHERDEP
jgi:hypothetical protein